MALLTALDRRSTIAPTTYNRWLIPPAALAVHLCIGQVYATSVYKTSLVAHFGTSPDRDRRDLLDRHRDARPVGRGRWHLGRAQRPPQGDVRRRLLLGEPASWSARSASPPAAVAVYLGYGVVGGIGLGIGYISPVSTLIKWFPDRPGLATGMAIMGFGGGALVASPLSRQLLSASTTRLRPRRPRRSPAGTP